MTGDTNSGYQPTNAPTLKWEEFEEISPGLAMGRIPLHLFDEIGVRVRAEISEHTASAEVLRNVQKINGDSFWGLFQRSDDGGIVLDSFYGQLLLTEQGERALLARSLDHVNPQVGFLAWAADEARAVYLWCVIAKGKAPILQPLLVRKLGYLAGLPHYATLSTDAGLKLGRQLGLKAVTADDDRAGGLFKLPAVLPTMRHSNASAATLVKVVDTAEELARARSIRAAAFMSEQNCPYQEEFDGNDYSAQHLVGYVDGEPAATIRIRYFSSFVKFERYAVLKQFRQTSVKDDLISFAIDLVRRKGFRQVYFHAQARLNKFWEKRGFSVFHRGVAITFSDHDYVEIVKDLDPHPAALTLDSSPMVLNRPEGCWDIVGILEKSAQRPVTRPC